MKIVFAHLTYAEHDAGWYARIAALAPAGLDVRPCPLTLAGREGRVSWEELDERWRFRDPALLALYRRVEQLCADADVLWNYNGAMLHPDFVRGLRCRTVFTSFDDPEDYPDLVEPVAHAYDDALHGNLASADLYHRHFPRSEWMPIFTQPVTPAPDAPRDIDLVFAGGVSGYSDYRRERLAALSAAFPDAVCVGRGWPRGYASREEIESLYRRARVGWNVHRTVGPVNQRLFELAQYGVAQVCDNRALVGQAFEIGKEVLAFNTIDQSVAQILRLLRDDALRASLADAARARHARDYAAPALWARFARFVASVTPLASKKPSARALPRASLLTYRQTSRLHRLASAARAALRATRDARASRPAYRLWKFAESVYIDSAGTPASMAPAAPATDHDTTLADLPPPRSVLAALVGILPAYDRVEIVGPPLPDLRGLVARARGAPGADAPDAPSPTVFVGWEQTHGVLTAVLHAPLSASPVGFVIRQGCPLTVRRTIESLARELGGGEPSVRLRAFVQPHADVPWLEWPRPESRDHARWVIVEITPHVPAPS